MRLKIPVYKEQKERFLVGKSGSQACDISSASWMYGMVWLKNTYKTTQMQNDTPGSLLWQPLWESSYMAWGFSALHTGESHFVIMFWTGKLLICICNKVFGASEKLFANAKLGTRVTAGISAEGCYKAKECGSLVKIRWLKVHPAAAVSWKTLK